MSRVFSPSYPPVVLEPSGATTRSGAFPIGSSTANGPVPAVPSSQPGSTP